MEKGNAIPGVDAITEQGGSETPLTKEADVKAKIKELEDKGFKVQVTKENNDDVEKGNVISQSPKDKKSKPDKWSKGLRGRGERA